MIRNFFNTILIFVLLCSTGYFYWKVNGLKSQNQSLEVRVADLQFQLAERHHHRLHQDLDSNDLPQTRHLDPVSDAELKLNAAEKAISMGNLGSAVDDCKLAAVDIQAASSSTSQSVRDTVGGLKAKLDTLDQQTSGLLKKLGA